MINSTNNRSCIGKSFLFALNNYIIFLCNLLKYDKDVNECEMWDECDQICINTNLSYSCNCSSNFTLSSGGQCRHQTSQRTVFFSFFSSS